MVIKKKPCKKASLIVSAIFSAKGCKLIRHSQGDKGSWGGEGKVLNKRTLGEMIC